MLEFKNFNKEEYYFSYTIWNNKEIHVYGKEDTTLKKELKEVYEKIIEGNKDWDIDEIKEKLNEVNLLGEAGLRIIFTEKEIPFLLEVLKELKNEQTKTT